MQLIVAREDIEAKDAEISQLKLELQAMKRERDTFKARYEQASRPFGSLDATEAAWPSMSALKGTQTTTSTEAVTSAASDLSPVDPTSRDDELRAIIKARDEKAAELKIAKVDAARKDAQLQLAHQLISTVYDSAKAALAEELSTTRNEIIAVQAKNLQLQHRLDDAQAAIDSFKECLRFIGLGDEDEFDITVHPVAAHALSLMGPSVPGESVQWVERMMTVLYAADPTRSYALTYVLLVLQDATERANSEARSLS